MTEQELDARIAEMMEPRASLPTITAHDARLREWGPNPDEWDWTTSDDIDSPLGWWTAVIGTDHGSKKADDFKPVRWRLNVDRAPSEDVAAAWLVVEKLIAGKWHFSASDQLSGGWFVRFWPESDANKECEAVAETLPLAICRAALLAVVPA